MLPAYEGTTVEKFDTAMMAELSKLPDVKVFDSVRPDDDRDGSTYIVYYPGDVIASVEQNFQPITGYAEAAVVHTFGMVIVAPSPLVKRKIQTAVRRVVLGFTMDGATPAVETGSMNALGDSDNTIKPIRYTSYVGFKVTIDRSV